MKYVLLILLSIFLYIKANLASSLKEQLAEGKHETYYSIIGVDLDATQSTIKKSYRQLAREYHPDRASSELLDLHQNIFVKLSNAYQILSDDTTRARYDYLLSQGELVYKNRDWSDFDKNRGANRHMSVHIDADGQEKFVFRDAYQMYQEAAEDRALLISFGIALLIALIPIVQHYRSQAQQKEAEKVVKVMDTMAVKEEYERNIKEKKERELEEANEKQREKEYVREMNRLHRETLQNNDLETEDSQQTITTTTTTTTTQNNQSKSALRCDVCKKSYKSEAQLSQHFSSTAHIKAVKNK